MSFASYISFVLITNVNVNVHLLKFAIFKTNKCYWAFLFVCCFCVYNEIPTHVNRVNLLPTSPLHLMLMISRSTYELWAIIWPLILKHTTKCKVRTKRTHNDQFVKPHHTVLIGDVALFVSWQIFDTMRIYLILSTSSQMAYAILTLSYDTLISICFIKLFFFFCVLLICSSMPYYHV